MKASSIRHRSELAALARVGLPVVFTNITLTAMQVTDAWMLGQLGTEALAAVTPPGLLIFLLQSFGYAFLTIVAASVAQAYGRGDRRRCAHFGWQGIYLGAAIGLLCLVLVPAAKWIFALYPNESLRVFTMEVDYFRISLLSLAPSLVTIALSNFFIGIQRNMIAVASSAVALAANVFLNYGLIFGAFGFPEWGFSGAAWGTVFATVLEVIILAAFFLSPRIAGGYGTRKPSFSRADLKRILRLGLPAGAQGGVDVAAWGILVSWLVAFFGTADQAAATILIRAMQLSWMPAEGIGVAALSRVGSALGEGDDQLVRWRAKVAFRVIAIYMTTIGIALFVFRRPLIECFTDDPAVIAIGAGSMIFVAIAQVFDAMNITYLNCLQAAGDTLWPSMVNLALCLAIVLGGGLAVVRFHPELGSRAIWALAAAYIAGQGLAFGYRWKSGRWRGIDLMGKTR